MRKTSTIRLTPAQQTAVQTVGRDVLVTASAGTGKTAALSQRCVARICDPENPVDVDRLLVLTFTDAAAEEMRSRIGNILRQAARQQRDSRLRQQAMLLDGAYISTIHAFCKRILTEFFHAADIDPAFGIIDEDEQRLLKSEILQETLEAAWQDPAMAEALRILLAGRRNQPGTKSFVDRIISLSAFLDSVAGREAFYERAARLNDAQDQAYAEILNAQQRIVTQSLDLMRQRLDYALALDAHYCGGDYVSKKIRTSYIPIIEECQQIIVQNRLDECAEFIKAADFGRLPTAPKGLDETVKAIIMNTTKSVRDRFKALREFAILNPAYDTQLAGAVSLQSRVLLELLVRFDRGYAAVKSRRNVLDFADLEHRMLHLLESNASAAKTLRERFEFVFIDEYQDINAVQQRILDCLCRSDNVFAVGDIKQSIYAFRQSRPEIFQERLAAASDQPEDSGKPLRIDMADNFRSRPEVLAFVNALFGRIMTEGVAGMSYDQRAFLNAQFEYSPFAGDHPVECILLDEDSGEDSDAATDARTDEEGQDRQIPTELVTASQRQAAYIAQRIRRMVGVDDGKPEFQIYDRVSGQYRDVRYGDIVILMRSLSHKANTYVEILRLAQIPVNAQSACGYFETTEIADCLNLLKTLDNPNGDIELAATLRSPLFGFDDTALVRVRAFADRQATSQTAFYSAVQRYADNGPDASLRMSLQKALETLGQWHQAAQRGSLARLLDEIFRQTGLLSFYAALPNGSVRKANLLKLHDRAIQFEHFRTSRPGMGLARFVEFLEKLRQEERDWSPGQPDSLENAVRIMSVHKSKGLEFPVVFAAELNNSFNLSDQVGECLIDEETIGLQIAVDGGRFRLNSPARQVLAERKSSQSIAEEMRILYVLLTRAREKLVMVASRKESDCRRVLTECELMSPRVADWKLRESCCHLDWVLTAFSNDALLHRLYETGFEKSVQANNRFIARRIGRDQLDALTTALLNSKRSLVSIVDSPSLTPEMANSYGRAYEQFNALLNQEYPFRTQQGICAKYSVSALTHHDDEYSLPDLTGAFDSLPVAVPSDDSGDEGILRRLTGSAAHLVLEHIPLDGPVTQAAVSRTLCTLVDSGLIAPRIAERIDQAGIAAFFETEPGRAACSKGTAILREWPFTLGIDATELGAEISGETIIVQGIVDMIIPVPGGLVVVDFKTDRLRDETDLAQRTEHYRRPLLWYSRAVESILKKPVLASWLYFTTCRKAVKLYPASS